jgi:hypothetical protein
MYFIAFYLMAAIPQSILQIYVDYEYRHGNKDKGKQMAQYGNAIIVVVLLIIIDVCFGLGFGTFN